jgi:hypothetical protein
VPTKPVAIRKREERARRARRTPAAVVWAGEEKRENERARERDVWVSGARRPEGVM